MKALVRACVLCVLGGILSATTVAYAQEEDPATKSVPAGVLAYYSVDLQGVQQFWTQIQGTPAVKALLEKAGKPGSPDPSPLIAQGMKMVGQAFTGRAAIGLADEKPAPGDAPTFMVAIPIKSQDDARALVGILQMQAKAKGSESVTRDYQGVMITTLTGGNLKNDKPSYAFLPDRMLFASQPAFLEKAIDVTAGRAPGLAGDARFKTVAARIAAAGPNVAWVWADNKLSAARAQKELQEAQRKRAEAAAAAAAAAGGENKDGNAPKTPKLPPFNTDVLKPFTEALDVSGARVLLSPTGISMEGFSIVNQQNEFGRKLLAQKGAPLKSAALTSGSAVFYAGMNNLPLVFDALGVIFGGVDEETRKGMAGMKDAIMQAAGINWTEDVVKNIGTEAALVLNDVPADLKSIPVLIYIQSSDKLGLGKAMQKLRTSSALKEMGVQFAPKVLTEGRIYQMEGSPLPIAPGWTFANDFLVIGTSAEAMKSPLFLAAGKGTALTAVPAFAQAAGPAGTPITGAFYMNLTKLGAILDKLPAPKPPKEGDAAAPAGPEGAAAAPAGKEGAAAKSPAAMAVNVRDDARFKAILKTLQSVTLVSGVGQDALTFKGNLAFDLNAR